MEQLKDLKLEIIYKSISSINGYANNTRVHSQEQIDQIKSSISEFGMCTPIGIHNETIVYGHGRWEALKQLNYEEIPTLDLSHLTDAQRKAFIIADNKIGDNSTWDEELLKVEIEGLQEMNFNIDLLGFSLDELDDLGLNDEDLNLDTDNDDVLSLSDRFGVPPFSIMDTRQGYWQNRKRHWKNKIGINSEKGRDENILGESKQADGDWGSIGGKKMTIAPNASIFDPVIAEIFYSFYSKKEDIILDPFAGGSVRGIVAGKLNRYYIGGELREEQVTENRKQANDIITDDDIMPVWINDDSLNIDKNVDKKVNLIFSCPPYADLEVYSDNPKDLSNMDYKAFIDVYRQIIYKSCKLLEDDSFAVFVVGEVRDKKGNYYNFVGDTIKAFIDAGLEYYVESILVEQSGTGAMRASKLIKASRKLVKTHQNILVFLKGDAKKATKKCGEIEMELIEEVQED